MKYHDLDRPGPDALYNGRDGARAASERPYYATFTGSAIQADSAVATMH
jgi:hypothetical protein